MNTEWEDTFICQAGNSKQVIKKGTVIWASSLNETFLHAVYFHQPGKWDAECRNKNTLPGIIVS